VIGELVQREEVIGTTALRAMVAYLTFEQRESAQKGSTAKAGNEPAELLP
jgi:hypothetical protein